MPKMKTHKGTAKRVKVTGTGKYITKKSGMSHILTKKKTKRKRSLNNDMVLPKGAAKMMVRLLPTGKVGR